MTAQANRQANGLGPMTLDRYCRGGRRGGFN